MPLYELILLAKVGSARLTTNLVKIVSKEIIDNGGVIREIRALGDRVLAKELRA